MADEAATVVNSEDVAVDDQEVTIDDGMPDAIANLQTYNGLLEETAKKLDALVPKLDAVLSKLSQIDTGSAGGGGAPGKDSSGAPLFAPGGAT